MCSCANIGSPSGGPRDTIPPSLIKSSPKQGQKNFKGNEIALEFDELMKLKNPKEEIIITPDIKTAKFSAKKSTVLIDFDEKLFDSTTYSISFREALQDLNEGNPAEDLTLAFSTGNEIDSLLIRGNVQLLLKGVPCDKYTVALYQSDTFDIFKHQPLYFTRTNKTGDFKMQNLKAGEYFIYTFEDKNKNLVLESKNEKFGFKPEKISIQADKDSIELKAIALDARPITIAGIRSLGHFTKVRLNKNLTAYTLTSLDTLDKKIRHCFSATQAEIDIFPNRPTTDSTLIKLTGVDSLNQTIDSTFYIKQTTARSLKEKIKVTLAKAELTDDSHKFYAELNTSELLSNILPDSIYIFPDTITQIPFSRENIRFDTLRRKIFIEKTFQKKDSIKWNKAKFILGGMAFTSIHGDSTKKSTLPISYITAEETATLIVEFPTVIPDMVIEILDEGYKPIASFPQAKIITIKNLSPTSFILRAISDDNKNGVWDPGNPNKKILPENISFYINQEGKKQIPLRANWEVNIKWNL